MPNIKIDLSFLHSNLLLRYRLKTWPTQVTDWLLLNLIIKIHNQDLISWFEIFKWYKTTKDNQVLFINCSCEGTARFEDILVLGNYLFPKQFLCIEWPNVPQKGRELAFLFDCTLPSQDYQVSVFKRNRSKLGSRYRLHSIYVQFCDQYLWLTWFIIFRIIF